MTKRIALLLLAALEANAGSTFRGLEPGKSTRADVARTLGAPVRTGTADEHNPGDNSGTVLISYRADGAIDTVEWRFRTSLARNALLASMNAQSESPVVSDTASGREYFGGAKTIVLVHVSADLSSAVASLIYSSQERFDSEVARLKNPSGPPPTTPQQAPGPALPDDVKMQFAPEACRDVYEWARTEQKIADKSKSATRRQALLEIRILSQRGDCEPARRQAETYRKNYR